MKLPFNYGISKDDCNIVLTNQQYVCLEAYVLPLKTINAFHATQPSKDFLSTKASYKNDSTNLMNQLVQ